MSVIDNERTKLLANAFDRASTACFTVGVASPLAGYLYGVLNFDDSVGNFWLSFTAIGWLFATIALTFVGKADIERLEVISMSFTDSMFWFTSLGLPTIIVIGGYIVVRLQERSLKR